MAYPSSVSFSVSFSQLYSQRALYIFNCLSSLSIHKSKRQDTRAVLVLYEILLLYSQGPWVILNCRSSLQLQTSEKPEYRIVVLSVSFTFIHKEHRFYPLSFRFTSSDTRKKSSYWSRNCLLVSFYYFTKIIVSALNCRSC